MVNYNKKTVLAPAERVGICGSTLAIAIIRLQRLADKYGDQVTINWQRFGAEPDLYIYAKRPESRQEMDNRIRMEEKFQQLRQQQHRVEQAVFHKPPK